MTNTITFDLETVPGQTQRVRKLAYEKVGTKPTLLTYDEAVAEVQAPGRLKKPESIEAWLEENRDSEARRLMAEREQALASYDDRFHAAFGKLSVSPLTGEIIAIAWKLNDGPAQSLYRKLNDRQGERSMLLDFYSAMTDFARVAGEGENQTVPHFVGHNIIGFDIPYVWNRAYVYGDAPPAFFPGVMTRPSDRFVFDTMKHSAGWSGMVSQDDLCAALNIRGKSRMTGADVWHYVRNRKVKDVAAYARDDVEIAYALYQRMAFIG